MIDRYSRPKMREIWSKENRYKAWLEVELLSCEAWAQLEVIPLSDVELMRANARIHMERIDEIEEETRHDVVAFTRAIAETLGPESKWVHYGLTSTDVVDTALCYILTHANKVLKEGLERLLRVLKDKALEHKDTIMMGRTHGVHAEPTTFGLKMLLWYEEMKRNKERFHRACEGLRVGKISGAVGTYAHVDPYVEKYVCDKLGLNPASISTQVLQRDRHAEYMAVVALIATSLEKFATEVRGLQKSEVREVEEGFARGQKGSSAMPHKRNPIGCENICGLARIVRGYMMSAYDNVPLWHERDISHSSVERIILPDATMLLDYMLDRFSTIIEQLHIYPENMLKNMDATFGLIYSQRVLLALVESGVSRESAYDCIQSLAMQAWDQKKSFINLVGEDHLVRERLTPSQIKACFNPQNFLKHVDNIFRRQEDMIEYK